MKVTFRYLMMCLLVTVSLMNKLFGGRRKLAEYLHSEQRCISFITPPCCCCCKCLPCIPPTERNLRRVERFVLQSPLVRIVLEILSIIIANEQAYDKAAIFINVLQVISMLLATYGCNILTILGQDKLQEYRFGTLFRLVNLTQLSITLQKFVLDLINRFVPLGHSPPLPRSSQSLFWNSFLITAEMCLLSVFATISIGPKRNMVFDKYHGRENANELSKISTTTES
ncbi:hypothetical protein AB6A40_009883 [Gnathostoma spinigerum]|uniref:Organic solute transporter subunit alpha n=1 Tax=Gnathostoma spinigerum TaxID=75299 RepID=A0ABD6ET74_9BILA